MGHDTRIAVDVAKAVFEVAISDRPGHVVRRERLTRDQFLPFMAQQPVATVVMEACGSSHHWARRIESLGHRVVPVKSVAQQVLTSLHRLRSGWVAERTARLNALRGLLRELGFFIPMGAEKVVPALRALIEDAESELPDALRNILYEACQEIRDIEARIKQTETQLEATARQIPAVALLRTVPGIGPLTSTALVAFLGNIQRFPSGRHLASYLGLTPREFSSGLKRRLGRISKRGDGYLRTLLIHGARSVLLHARKAQPDRLRLWAHKLEKTLVHNKAAVAVANKMARILWAVWSRQTPYGSLRKAA
jgi:transposase